MSELAPRDNGLQAGLFVPLVDVDPEIGPALLDVLKRARIAAFLSSPEGGDGLDRLHVARDERADAHTIVTSAMRTIRPSADGVGVRDAADDLDTDSAFAQLVRDWQVDTTAAVRAAERDLTREDADWQARLEPQESADAVWLEEEHYVPPPPPPLPRLAAVTLGALLLLIVSIGILAFGVQLGLDGSFSFLTGVAGILVSAGVLMTRLRDRPDDSDDGAVL